MKKKVDYITISNKLADFLIKSLNSDEVKSTDLENEKSELKTSLTELISGQTNSLVLDCESSESFVYDDVIRAENLEIYRKERKVIKNGTEVLLTPKEFDILFFLASNRGEVFTKEQIYYAVWKERYFLDESNIMAFIRKIRKKIETNPDAPKYILIVWGIGYKFVE